MVRRIEVSLNTPLHDAAADSLLARLKSDFGQSGLKKVRRVNVYSFEEDLSEADARLLAGELLCDPVSQKYSLGRPLVNEPLHAGGPPNSGQPLHSNFTYAIEVGFRPGVKDNVGETAAGAAADILGRPLNGTVFTSTLYLFYGQFDATGGKDKAAAEGILCNPLIERWASFDLAGMPAYYSSLTLPLAGEKGKGTVYEIPLPDSDGELERISKRRLLALSISEMRAIREHYARDEVKRSREKLGLSPHPTDVELECLAQTWSEHCKHKIFNATIDYTDHSPQEKEGGPQNKKEKAKEKQGKTKSEAKSKSLAAQKKLHPSHLKINSLFKTYISATTQSIHSAKHYLLSVFVDNAGIMAMDDDWALAVKVETHNTPSALDPYGGALTGILGVNRDVIGAGMGAKPIFNTDVFCFADPFYAGVIPPRLLHPRRVFEGVRAGVERGGNASGIPTVNGSVYFDNRYLGKPLVYCGTGGLMPRKAAGRLTHQKYIKAGDRIFMVGGRIGKDGIHGATFSSETLHEGSPTSAVQLGDPFTQKGVLDFLLASRDAGLHSGLTDDGAGGLSSSVGELAGEAGGALIHLDRCPLKYPGLDPWEILLSESQERMTVAVPTDKAGDFAALALRFSVEATDIGEFNASGSLMVKYHDQVVADLNLHFLHKGVPKMQLRAEWKAPELEEPDLEMPSSLTAELLTLLSRPNICSKESIVRQYDHEVQGMSVVKPMCGANGTGPSDAAVLQPLPGRPWGVVVSHGLNPRYGDIDPYHMAMLAVDEAVRNYIATGGEPHQWGALDNFCWPDPVFSPNNLDGAQKLAALVRASMGLSEACSAYSLPLVSGKDSMKNDYAHGQFRISVPPTLLVSVAGKIPDVERAVTSDFKAGGDLIYVLGSTADELGASEYYAMHEAGPGANVPRVDLQANLSLYKKLYHAIHSGLVASAHDCSDGGLAVALAECCIGGQLGAKVKLAGVPLAESLRGQGLRDDKILFAESAGRFIVSIHPQHRDGFEKAMDGAPFACVGEVAGGADFVVEGLASNAAIRTTVSELEKAFKKTITW